MRYHSTGHNVEVCYLLHTYRIILRNLNYRLLFVRLTVAQLSNEFPFIMEQGDFLPEIQKSVFFVTVTARYVVYLVARDKYKL